MFRHISNTFGKTQNFRKFSLFGARTPPLPSSLHGGWGGWGPPRPPQRASRKTQNFKNEMKKFMGSWNSGDHCRISRSFDLRWSRIFSNVFSSLARFPPKKERKIARRNNTWYLGHFASCEWKTTFRTEFPSGTRTSNWEPYSVVWIKNKAQN